MHDGAVEFGIVEGDEIVALEGDPFGGIKKTDARRKTADVKLLAPVAPSKVVAVGLNYQEHIDETDADKPTVPVLFIKPSTSVIGPGEPIIYPPDGVRVDYEAELALVIGKECRRAKAEEANDYIFGYTCLNDVTERMMQMTDGQWTRGKSFDTFCPIGPYIVTDVDPKGLAVEAYVNGEQKQAGNTNQLIFGIEELIAFISGIMTLLPGDVIATGTPSGIGPVEPGDEIEIRVENVGSLINTVEKSDA
jgi:2-keto-4-pentenoate hydratase/2-oxohepta-3-ene-1,7-dioic acid hydratase in catechol pathway